MITQQVSRHGCVAPATYVMSALYHSEIKHFSIHGHYERAHHIAIKYLIGGELLHTCYYTAAARSVGWVSQSRAAGMAMCKL
jgi:hypothetical protein